MKRLQLFKIVFFVLSIILISGCSGKSVKGDPENFQFKLNETWRIERWFDTSGSLKITERTGSNSYRGVLTVTYVDNEKKLERIKTVNEVLEITVDKKSIKMIGKEVIGSTSWSLDNFSFKIHRGNILKGISGDGRGNGGEIILSKGKEAPEAIDTEKIQGVWNLSEKDVKKAGRNVPLKSIKLNFKKDSLIMVCKMSDKKMVLDLIFTCRWKMRGAFAEVYFNDFDLEIDLDYDDPEIRKMAAAKVQLMRDLVKAKQGGFKQDFEDKMFKNLHNKPVYFNLVKTDSGEIEIRKDKNIYIIGR